MIVSTRTIGERYSPARVLSLPLLRMLAARVALAAAILFGMAATSVRAACELPSDFVNEVVFGGHTFSAPSAIRFASNGKVFVAERSGIIKVFDSVDDPTPTIFADLSTNVYAAFDRGLLGLAIHPNFDIRPLVYVFYTHDAEVGGTAPLWNDSCPDPPGVFDDGCVVSSRLSRLRADGDVMTGSEIVMLEGWCQQYSSHSAGDLRFGPDNMLYASHGEGANFQMVDTGGLGGNPCGDPPKEGGALRAQDLRTSGDPISMHGSIIRLHPTTGLAPVDNPLFGGTELGDDYIVAYGLRNPFRFAFRPGTSEIWIGNVGWNSWEEIERLVDPLDSQVQNFGWPCYEGFAPQVSYDARDIPICEDLYTEGSATPPYFAYPHLPMMGSAIAGIAFYDGATFPDEYQGALFYGDYVRGQINMMFPDQNGDPDTSSVQTFLSGARPVDMQVGPDGSLYHIYFLPAGPSRIYRIRYAPPDRSPAAWVDCMNGPNVAPTPQPPGTLAECLRAFDFDCDSDVDLADYVGIQDIVPPRILSHEDSVHFLDCLDGPNQSPSPLLPNLTSTLCIQLYDLEGNDGDVDLRDFAFFTETFTFN